MWDVVAALGTVAAVIVAALGTWTASQVAEREQHARERSDKSNADREQREREREYRREAQALVWWTQVEGGPWSPRSATVPEGANLFLGGWDQVRVDRDVEYYVWARLLIRNGNQVAMKHVAVRNGDTHQTYYAGTLGPGEHEFFVPVVGRGSPGSAYGRTLAHIADGGPIDWVKFVDSRDVVWKRLRLGAPEEVDEEPDQGQAFVP